MPSLTADDQTQLHYRVLGSGPQTVMLVHGWMVSGAVWDRLLEVLDPDGLRLIVPDLRGTGASEASHTGYSLERQGRDLLAIADAVGAASFALVGHSMGGQIAQWVAAEAPERVSGLALLCAVSAAGTPLPAGVGHLFRSSAGDEEKQGTILDLACKHLPESEKRRLLADAGRIGAACIQGTFDAWTHGGFAGRLGAITAPTLVLGTDDPFFPPSVLRGEIASRIPRARFTHLPGPGHYPQVERPRETAALLDAFFTGLRSGERVARSRALDGLEPLGAPAPRERVRAS